MLQIHLDTSALTALERKALQLKNLAADRRLPNNIGQLLAARGKTNIEQGTPDGKASYRLLKPSTLKQKVKTITPTRGKNKGITRAVKGTAQPLVRTGQLKASINYEVSDRLYLKAVKYAAYHQTGTKNMPARPVFSVRKEDEEEVLHFIRQTLNRIISNK